MEEFTKKVLAAVKAKFPACFVPDGTIADHACPTCGWGNEIAEALVKETARRVAEHKLLVLDDVPPPAPGLHAAMTALAATIVERDRKRIADLLLRQPHVSPAFRSAVEANKGVLAQYANCSMCGAEMQKPRESCLVCGEQV